VKRESNGMGMARGAKIGKKCGAAGAWKISKEAPSSPQLAKARAGVSAKNAVPAGHEPKNKKKFEVRLRDFGCPDTLIKDVRDVAAAVMCSEGPGQVEKQGLNRLKSPGHLKQKPR
jgi:hypothetical protein